METLLDWVLGGNTGVRGSVKQFWQIEEASEMRVTDNDLCEQFSKSVRLKDKHYVVKLLWKQENNTLQDNY